MGRPLKTVSEADILELASKGRTCDEIAAYCDIAVATLYRRFKRTMEKGHILRNGSLRSKQFDVAMHGNTVMLKWLGQQYLGQSDKTEVSEKSIQYGVGETASDAVSNSAEIIQ